MIQAWEKTMRDLLTKPYTLPSTPSPSLSYTEVSTKLYTGEGLSQNRLCDRFNIGSKSIAARAKRRGISSQQFLEERTGWRYNESDRKYYPPE